MSAEIRPLPRRQRPPPAEVLAVIGLLTAVADPGLRRYCLEQIGAAEDPAEVAAALALTRVLGERPVARAAQPRLAVAACGCTGA